jgi:8-oxo-dGTP pyrophosphatase MutT (NUDIX family)
METARREIREEVGLELPPAAVLGQLDDFLSRSRHLIAPFVLWADGVSGGNLAVNAQEVAAAYRVPLAQLDEPGSPVREPLLHFNLPLIGTSVYAPTAAILLQFRELALHGRHVSVKDEEQPYFAWR